VSTGTVEAWDAIIRVPEARFNYNKCALIIIDLQYMTASRQYGAFKKLSDLGHGDGAEYAISRIENTVVPNVARLCAAMRRRNLPVIYARCGSLRGDGSDQTRRHREQGLTISLEQKEAQILEGIAPQKGDIVLTKSGSGCFTSTNLNHILRNMGVADVILTGIWTNSCVETTSRDAGDLDYRQIIVEDCCAAITKDLHDHALTYLDKNWADVRSCNDVLKSLG